MSAEKVRPRSERTAYFDWLRVAAALAVMMIHVCAQHWYDTDVNGAAWRSFNLIDSLVSCAVPIFVMISGALFLNREIPLSKLLSKYCLRMLAAYFFWSLIYALFEAKSPAAALALTLRGHFHMWFLPMIIGLYLCVPLFRALTEEMEGIKDGTSRDSASAETQPADTPAETDAISDRTAEENTSAAEIADKEAEDEE